MDYGERVAKTKTERDLVMRCYKAGMKNGWASGDYAMADGDFITEEDRLNESSICIIDDAKNLEKFLGIGWCLGQGVIYKNLFFLQQINGGDEWATYRITKDKIDQFESITFSGIIKRGEFQKYLEDLQTKDYWKERG